MLPNEVKPYSESYQWIWKHRNNYQEFRFNIMNMLVDDAFDSTNKNDSMQELK
jgi:hypothetical protein